MKQFSYNSSPTLRFALSTFEEHRRSIVLTPFSPKEELRLRWDALVNRTYGMLTIAGYVTSKKDIVMALGQYRAKKTRGATLTLIEGIRLAWDEIRRSWLVTDRPITFQTIESLTSLVFPKELGLYRRGLRNSEAAIRGLLDYLAPSQEHALIRASVAFIGVISINPFDRDSRILASLLYHLFLHTVGLDARGLIDVETLWASDKETFTKVYEAGLTTGDYTAWLEYSAQTSVTNLELIVKKLVLPSAHHELPAGFFSLNDRQHRILSILEEPDRKTTNKDVQGRYRVSQITASRDLSKLAQLGLLYAHGKGRSVYYTKV